MAHDTQWQVYRDPTCKAQSTRQPVRGLGRFRMFKWRWLPMQADDQKMERRRMRDIGATC
jgi:hypothetical protein